MGTEIVFVWIFPIAALCLGAAAFFWFRIARLEQPMLGGLVRAYLPLIIGFTISIAGLAVLSYVSSAANFTALIQQGYYTEAERSAYLPRWVVGQAILSMIFVLPAICFVVVPLTVSLIKNNRLTFKWITLYAVAGWLALSLLGWLLNLATFIHPLSLLHVLAYTASPLVIYGLPIPVVALLFFKLRASSKNDKVVGS